MEECPYSKSSFISYNSVEAMKTNEQTEETIPETRAQGLNIVIFQRRFCLERQESERSTHLEGSSYKLLCTSKRMNQFFISKKL